MIQVYKLNSCVFSMHDDLLLLSLDSTLPQVRNWDVRSVHQLYSPFLNSLHDSRCLYTAFTSYKSTSNSTTPRLSTSQMSARPTAFNVTVTMGCYGLLWLIVQQISYYTAASAIDQILALYDIRAQGLLGPRALTSFYCDTCTVQKLLS